MASIIKKKVQPDMKGFLRISHRGQSGKYPENSLGAFEKSINAGADMIELDIFQSTDNYLVVIHDPYIDELSNGQGLVKKMTLKELKKYNFNKKNNGVGRIEISTLNEVIELCRGRVRLNIEIKNYLNQNRGIEDTLVKVLRDMSFLSDVLVSSFDHRILMNFKKMEPRINTGMLYTSSWLHFRDEVKELKVRAILPRIHGFDEDQVSWAREKGLRVYPWVARDRTVIALLHKTGLIDGIMVDDLELFNCMFI